MEGDLMRIVLNNNINNNLDVYFQRNGKFQGIKQEGFCFNYFDSACFGGVEA